MTTADLEEIEYIALLEQEEREIVSPPLEQLRITDKPIAIVQGGRGAGAKSWSIASLIVQMCQYQYHRVACLREVQLTLTESVYQLIIDTIQRLEYTNDWNITLDRITNKKTGAFIIFRGLRDLRAARAVKGLEGVDIAWCDEAATIIDDSWSMLIPTLVRNDGWRLFVSYNPETDFDPCTVRFWNSSREDVLRIRVEPGKRDNPWWNDGLQNEMDALYKDTPDEAEHVYGGQPRKQGECAILSRVAVRAAMTRDIEAIGAVEVGVDIARFGEDKTQMYKRRGFKIIDHKQSVGVSNETNALALSIWEFAGRDPSVKIKIDEGYNPGVVDCVRSLGGNVIAVSFGGTPRDRNAYVDVATEMYGSLPIDQMDIPDDAELSQDLTARLYDYEPGTNRKKLEQKKFFKDRFHRSPDKGDALVLTFYQGGGIIISPQSKSDLAKRRARGR